MNAWSGVRVLVTGARGFIGARLAAALAERGALVTRIVPSREESGIGTVASTFDTWVGTTRDAGFVERLLTRNRIEVCFHLAAISQVGRAAAIPVATFEDNVQGTWTLLEACRRLPTLRAFVLASSDKVYGDQGERICAEDAPLNAEAAYDASKACADIVTRTYAREYGVPAIVGRFCNVFGPGDRNLERLVPKTALLLAANRPPVIHAGTGDFVREFLHVDDAIAALLLLAEHAQARAGQAFNVGSGERLKVREAVSIIASVSGSTLAPIEGPTPPFREIRHQRLDSSRLGQLGWAPKRSFREALPETIAWYRDRYGDRFERGS